MAELLRYAGLWKARLIAPFRRRDIAFFHEFAPPPGGGGHQFLRALWDAFERRGYRLENNQVSRTTQACLFNSFNFDFARLRALRRRSCRMVHRVDGPVGVYRGRDDGTDRRLWKFSQDVADATIFQSDYSLRKHAELGLVFPNPVVIHNATDAAVFHARGRAPFDATRKVRLLSAGWSDNPNKGGATYLWLEEHLDWDRVEYTHVGRSSVEFRRIRTIPPVGLATLADLMRQHDVFITASRFESCPNIVLEALACGLPVLYHKSGGTPELVGEAGFGFEAAEEIPGLLDRLTREYAWRQSRIRVRSIDEAAAAYLAVMGVKALRVALGT